MLLCDFNYYADKNEPIEGKIFSIKKFNFPNDTNNISISSLDKVVQSPYAIEYVLIFWIISFIFEEFNQVINL